LELEKEGTSKGRKIVNEDASTCGGMGVGGERCFGLALTKSRMVLLLDRRASVTTLWAGEDVLLSLHVYSSDSCLEQWKTFKALL